MGQTRKITTGKTRRETKPIYRKEGNLYRVGRDQWGRAPVAPPLQTQHSPNLDYACYIVVITQSISIGVAQWSIGCVEADLASENRNDATIAACRTRGGWIVLDAPPSSTSPLPILGPISTREMRTITISHAEEIARQINPGFAAATKASQKKIINTIVLNLQNARTVSENLLGEPG